jgi:hypothetical protein
MCNRCWELRGRIDADPVLARRMLTATILDDPQDQDPLVTGTVVLEAMREQLQHATSVAWSNRVVRESAATRVAMQHVKVALALCDRLLARTVTRGSFG